MKTQTRRRLSRTKETLRTMGKQPMKPNTKPLFRELNNRHRWKDNSRDQTRRGLSKTKGKLGIMRRQHVKPNTKTIFREPRGHYEPNRQPMKPIYETDFSKGNGTTPMLIRLTPMTNITCYSNVNEIIPDDVPLYPYPSRQNPLYTRVSRYGITSMRTSLAREFP